MVGPRRQDAAASVGTYIALATANRVVDPCSKRKFADWWKTTAGDRFVRRPASALDHRRFWEAMDAISEDQAGTDRAAHREPHGRCLLRRRVGPRARHDQLRHLHRLGQRARPIAQRGHAKQKRSDLRIVGLGLVVSTDGGIPLLSHAYAGNKPDVTQFPSLVEEFVTRFAMGAGDGGGLTLVYDAGQNSMDNQPLIEGSPLHFVGSLPPSPKESRSA